MSEREHENLTPEQALAQRAVRGLSSPKASDAFRSRLKEQFVSGTIPETQAKVVTIPWYRRPGLLSLGIAAAAAAVLIIAVLGNRGQDWKLEGTAPERLEVNGEIVSRSDLEARPGMLKPGTWLATPDTMDVTLVSPNNLVVQMTPQSEMLLPKTPGRWFGRTIRAVVTAGEIRFTTDEGFHGAKLIVHTPEVAVEVLGTTIAVIKKDFGTCVCVLEGQVKMGPRDGPMGVVKEGRRRTIFNDGREPFEEDILPMERMKLEMLRDAFTAPGD